MLLLVGAMGAVAVAAYVQSTPDARRVPDDLRKPEPAAQVSKTNDAEPTAARPHRQDSSPRRPDQTSLMVPTLDGQNVVLRAASDGPSRGEDPKVFVANAALRAVKVDGARALGVQVKDGVAVIDFNPALEQGFGSMEEGTLIKALQMGMGQFKDVDKVQIMVEGKPIESLGHFELTDPLPVIRSLG